MVTILLYIPPTMYEVIFSICAIFISAGVFGYTLNTINSTLEDISRKTEHIKKENDQVNVFLKRTNLPSELKERIL